MDYYLSILATIMMVFIAVYFGFICVFGDRQDRKHAVILCFASTMACIAMYNSAGHDVVLSNLEYANALLISMLWDILTAAALMICMMQDRKAAYQALVLCLVVPITIVMIWELEFGLVSNRGFVYTYHKELLITIGAMQIAVSYDGFILAVGNVPERTKGFFAIFNSTGQGDTSPDAES